MCSNVADYTNQGMSTCSASYAFAANGVIETNQMIRNGDYVDLSEQQILECSQDFGNYGCNGGFYWNAFEYAQQFPLFRRTDYNYDPSNVGACKFEQLAT